MQDIYPLQPVSPDTSRPNCLSISIISLNLSIYIKERHLASNLYYWAHAQTNTDPNSNPDINLDSNLYPDTDVKIDPNAVPDINTDPAHDPNTHCSHACR